MSKNGSNEQNILNFPPMDRALIETLPQLQPLMEVLKNEDLVHVAWEVLGGIPSDWEGPLQAALDDTRGEKREAVQTFLRNNKIMVAISTKVSYVDAHPFMDPVLEAIMKSPTVSITSKEKTCLLKASQKNQPSPDKVLSIEKQNRMNVVVPASCAMRLVLKHKLHVEPTLAELIKLTAVDEIK